MKGSIKRRCTVCGSRRFTEYAPKRHSCHNGHIDSFTWSFIVDVARPGEPRKQIGKGGFATRKEAEIALAALIVDDDRGSRIEPSKILVSDQVENWLARVRSRGLTSGTIASYETNLRLHIIPRIGNIRLQALTTGDLDRMYADLLANGRIRQKGKSDAPPGLSARTVRYCHTIIAAALSDAVRTGLLAKNPATYAAPPSAKAARAPEQPFWTHEQLAIFLKAAKDHELWPLWRTAALTGMRRGELCGLRWSDIDLHGDELAPGRIRVAQQYTSDGYGVFRFSEPKSDKGRRPIDLDPQTVEVLRKHQQKQREEHLAQGMGRPHLVFESAPGAPLRPDSSVSAVFTRLVNKLEVPRLSIHGLRHTHCSHLVAAGTDLKAVCTRMGHASVSFTLDRYGHLLPGAQAPFAAKVAELLESAL